MDVFVGCNKERGQRLWLPPKCEIEGRWFQEIIKSVQEGGAERYNMKRYF